MVSQKVMTIDVKDTVDIIDAMKSVKESGTECLINMHNFEENSDGALKILMRFKSFAREENLPVRFVSFNGTLAKVREYLKKCALQKSSNPQTA